MSDFMPDDESQFLAARLTRLADGSLPESERAQLGAEVRASPEQTAALAQQRQAVSLLRSVDVAAPYSLRSQVEAMAHPRAARRRLVWPRIPIVAVGAAFAAALVAFVLVISAGSSAPTVPQTAHLALFSATLPAPPEDDSHANLLALHADGIPFPNYVNSIGWEAAGVRRDTLHGRTVTTVFYTDASGQRIGYAIVSGAPLTVPAGRVTDIGGIHFTLARSGSAQLITWRRAGHTCIIAGRDVRAATLLDLAVTDNEVV
jgi:hypothetical protein